MLGLDLSVLSVARRQSGGQVVALTVPYSEDSYWNVQIPASPDLHASSAAIVTKLTSWDSGDPQAIQAGHHGTAEDFTVPVYTAAADDTLYTVSCSVSNSRTQQVNGSQIRLPTGAVAAGGSDAHIVVIQPDGWVFEAFDVASISGGTLSCNMGGRTRLYGEGFDAANAYASKTGALGGRITTAEWLAAASGQIEDFGHAIAIMVKSTDGTNIWPASGNAAAADATNAPPCGAWLQATWTDNEINALDIPVVAKAFLRTAKRYGLIVMDTTGNNGSWIPRSVGDDTADNALGLGTPFEDHAVAQGEGGGWFLDTGVYYFTSLAGLDWAGHLQVLSSSYMKALFDARLAAKRLDPASTVSNNWTLTGAATAHAALIETTILAPFAASNSPRIGDNTTGEISEVKLGTLTIPSGKQLSALTAAIYCNTQAATYFSMKLRSGTTDLTTLTVPAGKTTFGWWFLTYEGSETGLDLADLRLRFEILATGTFCNVYAAYALAEFEDV